MLEQQWFCWCKCKYSWHVQGVCVCVSMHSRFGPPFGPPFRPGSAGTCQHTQQAGGQAGSVMVLITHGSIVLRCHSIALNCSTGASTLLDHAGRPLPLPVHNRSVTNYNLTLSGYNVISVTGWHELFELHIHFIEFIAAGVMLNDYSPSSSGGISSPASGPRYPSSSSAGPGPGPPGLGPAPGAGEGLRPPGPPAAPGPPAHRQNTISS